MNIVSEARSFAREKHTGQKYGDQDYFYGHIVPIVGSLDNALNPEKLTSELCDIVIATAYLHDVLEDCDVTYEEIEERFGREIATYVGLLTKKVNQSREDYLEQVSLSLVTKLVKLHDSMFNATQCFCDGDFKRFDKYCGYIGKLGEGET